MLSDENFKAEYWIVELDGTGFRELSFFVVCFSYSLVFDGDKKREIESGHKWSKKSNEISRDQGVCIMKVKVSA